MDNPALRNAHRTAADAGRRAAESAGARPTSVVIVIETWSAALGTSTATLSSTSSTTLDPRPKVAKVSPGSPSYFGGGMLAQSDGHTFAPEYAIGPITTATGSVGYTLAQLVPAGGVTHKVYALLSGDAFAAGGERFEAHDVDSSRPHQITLRVHRAPQ
jgi:hypothetical protein